MTDILTLDDLDLDNLEGVPTLVRVDFNVPLAGGRVMDDTRLRAALPTIRELKAGGARVLLMSHCGRPKGQVDPEFSLRPVAAALGELLEEEVAFAEDCVGQLARDQVALLEPGRVCLLENLRFHPGETTNDPELATRLAELGQVYVNDAFGTAHRAHASVVGVPERIEHKAAGRLMVDEVVALGSLLGEPERPFTAIVGGAKIGDKLATISNLLDRLDVLVLGGGMANTFLASLGYDLADSLVENNRLDVARDILHRAQAADIRVLLPADLVVTDDLDNPQAIETVSPGKVPEGAKAVDIGEIARLAIGEALAGSKTVLWNGPMGVFEIPPFDAGTVAVAEAVAKCDGFTVVGGGETVAAVRRAGVADRISHISTGGGASLEFLAGKPLPGLVALEKTS
ncbi:MAG: phosphoglycerate kinase [Nitrospirae bacterium]|nr:phosphoglycerate kinase [Nitrospirota bacterium]